MDSLLVNVKNERGFSLVELMVVVAIIGVLSAIALPQFKVFQAKARQAEAKSNLANVFTLEQAYQAENDTYAVFTNAEVCAGTGNPIGFYLTNCGLATGTNGPRYTYSGAAGATGITSSFLATAASGTGATNRIIPGCAVADTWTIDETQLVTAVKNAVLLCP